MCVLSCFSCILLFVIVWAIVCQAPLFMGFSRQEYWNGLPCPPPGDLPDPGIKPKSLRSPALPGGSLPLVPLELYKCMSPLYLFYEKYQVSHVLYHVEHLALSSFGFYHVCSVSWRAFHVNTYRSSTYLSKRHLVFYQKGRGFHSSLMSVPDGWVERFPSLFFVCLVALATYSPMWMLWGMCVPLTQRRS